MAKSDTDWEAIERDYRAGVLSLREIANQQDPPITEGAIRKRAKTRGWERDLSARVNEKVRNELVRSEVRADDPKTEREIVEVAAATVVQVVRGHRANIKRMNALAIQMLDELDEQTINRELYAELGVMLRSEDDKAQDKRNDLYQKIISGSRRIDGLKKLAETMKVLVALERQAFNIADGSADADDGKASVIVDPVESARQIAFILAKAMHKGA